MGSAVCGQGPDAGTQLVAGGGAGTGELDGGCACGDVSGHEVLGGCPVVVRRRKPGLHRKQDVHAVAVMAFLDAAAVDSGHAGRFGRSRTRGVVHGLDGDMPIRPQAHHQILRAGRERPCAQARQQPRKAFCGFVLEHNVLKHLGQKV